MRREVGEREKNKMRRRKGEKELSFPTTTLAVFLARFSLPRSHYLNAWNRLSQNTYGKNNFFITQTTGCPSSKYEHRETSALLRNIRNVRICMGKKPIVSVTYENERTSIKNSLPYMNCVLRLSCVVHGPIYGRFVGCTVNGFLSLFTFI